MMGLCRDRKGRTWSEVDRVTVIDVENEKKWRVSCPGFQQYGLGGLLEVVMP
jgi:hypothetical protein